MSTQLGRRFLSGYRSLPPPLEVSTFELHAAPEAVMQARLGAASHKRNRPTAFVCADDAVAAALIQTTEALGLRVPRDLSVIGWGDGPSAALGARSLTTVRLPTLALADAAVDLL